MFIMNNREESTNQCCKNHILNYEISMVIKVVKQESLIHFIINHEFTTKL